MSGARGIVIAISALALAAVLWGGFFVLLNLLSSERTALSQVQSEKTTLYTRESFSSNARTIARDTYQQRQQLEAITQTHNVVDIVEVLEEVGDATGTDVSVVTVSTDARTDVYETLTVILRATGSFADVAHVLSLLETPPIAAAVDAYDIAYDGDGSWNIEVHERVLVERNR